MRLQKLLANAGVASRRKAEELISAGRVRVNGKVVTELGAKATASDEITVDGVPLAAASKKKYIMLHKPEKVVTTVSDQFGRATVMDYVPRDVRLFPVGRLDYETSGLILLTNDGDWANTLMHPSNEVNKTYIAVIRGKPTPAALQAFRTGITIEGRRTAPCKIATTQAAQPLFSDDMHSKPHKRHEASNSPHADTTVKITIHEGRNRQVRKMCEAIGHPVKRLKRIAIGEIELGELPQGKWRELTESEVSQKWKKS